MIEKIIVDYLNETMSVPAFMEMPEIPPVLLFWRKRPEAAEQTESVRR